MQRRIALHQGKRRPEPRVAAADDRDVGLDVTLQRRRRLAAETRGQRLFEPPDAF
ncbi:MAG: hypothetical protein ACXVRE_00795 [Gaiellaceae bacterium]